ncbi:MAG TPA: Kazal-type serine protease inhibitor domain-containing protein, partial [Polyangiaceae bacterium]|nr:Kazal-type serine protease inhibitor domain-containing protein [Polyangiaceae bacterium]
AMGCFEGKCIDFGIPDPCGAGCPPGEYCAIPAEAGCSAAHVTATCTPRPNDCGEIYAPVCACNGVTYSNECDAAASGISVAYQGECGTAPLGLGASCGSRAQGVCADGLFCQHQPGALCGAADAPGECVAIPSSCPSQGQQVCGCNGVTYANACNAALAQVGILEEGRCN